MERTKTSNVRNGSKEDSNPRSLDGESGVLPLNYRAVNVLSSVVEISCSVVIES